MRKFGWYGDSLSELTMNIGTWTMIFAVGMFFGTAHDSTTALSVFIGGSVIGVGGQLIWWYNSN
jgi:hypothetical protein